jgi:hypothetical protein
MKKQTGLAVVLAVALSALAFSSARASVVYTYEGNPFNLIQIPYTTGDRVTGSLTLATALAANLILAPVVPLSFSFSDGLQTISELNADISKIIDISTDDAGDISQWEIRLSILPDRIATVSKTGQVDDFGASTTHDEITAVFSSIQDEPGVWTSSISPTPLPAALPMFGTGLSVLGLFGWLRKRKMVAAIPS